MKKICIHCRQLLLFDCFCKNKAKRDGFNSFCKECNKQRCKQYYQDNKEKIIERSRQHYQNNGKQYYQNNKEKMVKSMLKYIKRRLKEDPKFKLNHNIKSEIRRSLKKQNVSKNRRHWEFLVGYTLEELINRLESQFLIGMTLENHGKWHIDHIKPISLFDFESTDDPGFKDCWALENLQPLWAEDNLRKSNKYQIEN